MPVGANINKVLYGVNISKGFITGLLHSDSNQPYNPNLIDEYDVGLALASTLPSTVAACNSFEKKEYLEKAAAIGVTGVISSGTALMINRLAYTAGYFSIPIFNAVESYLNK